MAANAANICLDRGDREHAKDSFVFTFGSALNRFSYRNPFNV
jgi:hypothetical protein